MQYIRFVLAPLILLAACAENHPLEPSVVSPDASEPALATATSGIVVMSNLNSPRGLAWGPDGALYVAEAGLDVASQRCAPVARGSNCLSHTGSITRLLNGKQKRVATELPSAYNAAVADIIGPHDISFLDRNAFISVGWGGPPAARAELGKFGSRFGALIRVRPNGSWSVVDDISAYEGAHNPAGGAFDSNPYGILIEDGHRFVTDAGANSLLKSNGSGVSLVATFPSTAVPPGPFNPPFAQSESVPTEVTRGPDGALYVSTLSGVPFLPGGAVIYRVVPGEAPQVHAAGFTTITDFDWGADGSLYVVQYASAPFLNGPGALIRVAPNGDRTILAASLNHPTGVLAGPDGSVYVSNNGNLPRVGEVLRFVP
jgi:hypothetical protein